VYHDILSYGGGRVPKFVKQYADAGSLIKQAIAQYAAEVRSGAFPAAEHTFTMKEETLERLYGEGVKI